MRQFRWYTVLIAILIGGVTAWLLLPSWRIRQAIEEVASADVARRKIGWTALVPTLSDPDKRLQILQHVNDSLLTAPDEAVLDAGATLRDERLWGWNHQPHSLMLREVDLLADREAESDQRLAAASMLSCPLDLDETVAIETFNSLLTSPHGAVRKTAFDGACGWAGLERIELLAELVISPGDTALQRAYWLALGWNDDIPITREAPPEIDLDVAEARLLALVRASSDTSEIHLDVDLPIPLAYILAQSDARSATDRLELMAESGDETARFALRARRLELEATAARRIALDESESPWRRRLAAWRWDDLDDDTLRSILRLDPTEPDGSVHATALLAEQRLASAEAGALALDWIADFNDDFKRAGALLAALLGRHADDLREALERENMGVVRTTQRLALWAMGRNAGTEDSIEFAHRALHGEQGDFNPDTVLCMLIAGHRPAMSQLTSEPRGDWRQSVQQRAWLIERFVPFWHERAGRPIGGDLRAARLHFDALNALRLLTHRRGAFGPDHRFLITRPTGASSSP